MTGPTSSGPRIGILVVAYNASATLASVLDRIPRAFWSRVDHVMVSDDASADETYEVGVGYRAMARDLALTVVRQERNLGYGGNQKWGYRWAVDHGLDVVVLLHGDGQYAPELLPEMVAPVVEDRADAVMGSRMLMRGGARTGGMPLYKFVGNKVLTSIQNRLTGMRFSEWHSGYRAYRVDALATLDYAAMSDDFDFDTQILLQLIDRDRRIVEIPIPTYYGDEISYVNGLRYAKDIVAHTIRHRLRRMGFGAGSAGRGYELKTGEDSSHQVLVGLVDDDRPKRILDLGCADGAVAGALTDRGHEVVGVDVSAEPGVTERVSRFVEADLDNGLPAEVDGRFDVVLLADVLEHVRDPGAVLEALRTRLVPDGRIIGSIPNFGHWYPRLRVVSGRFDYDARGILDRGHLRFFTRRTYRALLDERGFDLVEELPLGLPVEVFARGGTAADAELLSVAGTVDRAAVRAWPTLFAYQFVFVATPHRS
ncbi:MAG: bifunctional glycosyltransferase/class I SAM-dependent methyltransferase [Acidimicrobiales bacterium]|nr:bifunctional glycosyltransferase/class I SAM-dependent methyltransferase [Acidimicrobiales bacterium]